MPMPMPSSSPIYAGQDLPAAPPLDPCLSPREEVRWGEEAAVRQTGSSVGAWTPTAAAASLPPPLPRYGGEWIEEREKEH